MSTIKYVSSREEFKSALQDKFDYIVVKDKKLAGSIENVKGTQAAVLSVVIIAAVGATTMFWNPLGWASGFVAVAAGETLTLSVAFLITVLGAGVIWALWHNWDIVARGKMKLPDGTELQGEIILSPR